MKRKTSFSIALSAVSCAIATIFMALGMHVPYMYLPGYVFGALAILLPLSEDFFGGACLAWIAASLICLPIGGIAVFYKLFPFIAFFGPHPIVNALLRRKGKNGWLARIVKAVWFDGMLCAAWAIFAAMTEVSLPFSWMYDWIYPMIVAAGTAVFIIYDWLMLRCAGLVSVYVSRIGHGKPPRRPPSDSTKANEKEDVFGFDSPASVPADEGDEKQERQDDRGEKK